MAKHFRFWFASLGGAAVVMLTGCGKDIGPTGVTCPQGGTPLTEQNFGGNFMRQYCTRCHSSSLSAASRHDAPVGMDFDTIQDVRKHALSIDAWAGASSTRASTEMPPDGGPAPNTEERRKLSEWLACGAP